MFRTILAAGLIVCLPVACATGAQAIDQVPGGTGGSFAGTSGASGSGSHADQSAAGNGNEAGTAASGGASGSGDASDGAGADGGASDGGAAAGGGSDAGSLQCGGETCAGAQILGLITLAPCCATGGPTECGLETGPLAALVADWPLACVARNMPGAPDATCGTKDIRVGMITITLPGCCTPTGRCGWILDLSTAGGPNVGCADSSPFFESGVSAGCVP